jgi:hypothetical protein
VPAAGKHCSDLTDAQYVAAPFSTVTLAIDGSKNSGNRTYEIVGPIVHGPGCYGWAERLTLTPSRVSVNAPPTAPHESAWITARAVSAAPKPAQPRVIKPVRALVPSLAQTGVQVQSIALAGLGLLGIGGILSAGSSLIGAARRRMA